MSKYGPKKTSYLDTFHAVKSLVTGGTKLGGSFPFPGNSKCLEENSIFIQKMGFPWEILSPLAPLLFPVVSLAVIFDCLGNIFCIEQTLWEYYKFPSFAA